jgi:UDPglucose--hexose-1-phosphate uridylyltransferase
VRVVPNLYPAFERQEVVVHSPRHVRSFAELSDAEIAAVGGAWRARARAELAGYLLALVNEGRFAGASRAHSHSQLVWLRETPPAVASETGAVEAVLGEYELAEEDGVALAVHPAGRVPYELVIAPRAAGGPAFSDRRLGAALRLLRDAARRLRALEGPLPWNAWLHDGPHWHLEVLPRLTQLAGLELGAGIYVNVVPPEEAADRLRTVAP